MSGNLSGSWGDTLSGGRLADLAGGVLGARRSSLNRTATDSGVRQAAATLRATPEEYEADRHGVLAGEIAATPAPAVLSEELFRSALIRERKRADRFDQVFALMTVEASEPGPNPLLLEPIAGAMSAATRDTDLIGWLERGAILGVLLPELVAPATGAAAQIEARIISELTRSLGAAALSGLRLRVHVHSGLGSNGSQNVSASDPLIAEIQSARKRAGVREFLKRALDVVLSLLLLTLLSPVFLIVAALIKLSSAGPVLFKQVRIGEMANPFTMLKFRSMKAAADPTLHQQFVSDFINSSHNSNMDGEAFFKIKQDPRITPIGRLLRKTSLDELPQLWNVLRGDMSLVGPRPPLQYELEQYRSWHWRRVLEAKPGMTGLWQVEGRSRTTFDEMVRLDLRYVRNRSLLRDIRILIATPRAVVTGKGAC
jgi:lipopolysaccharide/colanic/teichoic acid biosynthesis glycosyltransferase